MRRACGQSSAEVPVEPSAKGGRVPCGIHLFCGVAVTNLALKSGVHSLFGYLSLSFLSLSLSFWGHVHIVNLRITSRVRILPCTRPD